MSNVNLPPVPEAPANEVAEVTSKLAMARGLLQGTTWDAAVQKQVEDGLQFARDAADKFTLMYAGTDVGPMRKEIGDLEILQTAKISGAATQTPVVPPQGGRQSNNPPAQNQNNPPPQNNPPVQLRIIPQDVEDEIWQWLVDAEQAIRQKNALTEAVASLHLTNADRRVGQVGTLYPDTDARIIRRFETDIRRLKADLDVFVQQSQQAPQETPQEKAAREKKAKKDRRVALCKKYWPHAVLLAALLGLLWFGNRNGHLEGVKSFFTPSSNPTIRDEEQPATPFGRSAAGVASGGVDARNSTISGVTNTVKVEKTGDHSINVIGSIGSPVVVNQYFGNTNVTRTYESPASAKTLASRTNSSDDVPYIEPWFKTLQPGESTPEYKIDIRRYAMFIDFDGVRACDILEQVRGTNGQWYAKEAGGTNFIHGTDAYRCTLSPNAPKPVTLRFFMCAKSSIESK